MYRITTTSFTFMNLLCLPSFLSIPIRLELSHTFCSSFLPSSQSLPRKKILTPPACSAFQSNSHNPPKLERSRPAPTTFRVSFYGINYLLAGTTSSSATPHSTPAGMVLVLVMSLLGAKTDGGATHLPPAGWGCLLFPALTPATQN